MDIQKHKNKLDNWKLLKRTLETDGTSWKNLEYIESKFHMDKKNGIKIK